LGEVVFDDVGDDPGCGELGLEFGEVLAFVEGESGDDNGGISHVLSPRFIG
jgi:hypothetical protein